MSNYKKISKNIQQVTIDNPKTKNSKVVWINVDNAGKSEMEYLRKNYNFKLSHLQASSIKTVAQRPLVEHGDDYFFMILHFPIFQEITKTKDKQSPSNNIACAEIEFFIGHGFLITIPNQNVEPLNEFFNYCKKDENSLLSFEYESSSILLYELLEKLIVSCYNILDQNSIAISEVEEVIFAQEQKKAASSILTLRHNIINFRKIMQNHKNIIKKLMEMESSVISKTIIKKYYNGLIENTKRIWEILENQREMIDVLYDTNETLLNYRSNNIIKTLTIFSVIVFPLTLLAAIFGMNVEGGMPFLHNQNGFWVIIAIMLMGSLFMLMIFEKKKWL